MSSSEHLKNVMRCGAKTRQGGSCQQPSMSNGRCRLHGGKSTGPTTEEGLEHSRKANWKHGYYSAEAKAKRKEVAAWMKKVSESISCG